jgi:hypothetical protein
VVGCDRERHELLEDHAVFGIDLVQLWRRRREAQPLLHNCWRHEMPGRNVFLGQPSVTQGLEGSSGWSPTRASFSASHPRRYPGRERRKEQVAFSPCAFASPEVPRRDNATLGIDDGPNI